MSNRRDVQKLVDRVEALGWSVEIGKAHYKCKHPKSDIVVMSATPSDNRALQNMKSDVNRVRRKHNEERI